MDKSSDVIEDVDCLFAMLHNLDGYVFRGQRSSEWNLEPSCFRKGVDDFTAVVDEAISDGVLPLSNYPMDNHSEKWQDEKSKSFLFPMQ